MSNTFCPAALGLLLVLGSLPALASSASAPEPRGLPDITSLEAVPEFVSRASIAKRWPGEFSGGEGENWRYWLIDSQIDRRSRHAVYFYDVAFEPLTAERLGDAGRYEIQFRDEYQTLALHELAIRRDGRWLQRFRADAVQLTRRQSEFESDFRDDQISALVVIDDVRVGDVVRIAFSVTGDNPVLEGHIHQRFAFASGFPTLWRQARVLFPPETKIDARAFERPPPARERRTHDALEWSVRAERVPAHLEELDLPGWHIDRPTWVLAPEKPWDEIVRWALPMYPADLALPDELADEVGKRRVLPEAERAAWALERVQEDVRYFATILGDSSHRPSPPHLTWERRYGDCKDKTQLLTTLLRALGIRASPALVSTAEGRNLEHLPPAATLFDHVIVTAIIDGERRWLDPTLSWQRGPIASRIAGLQGFALIVEDGQHALTPMPEADAAAHSVHVREHYEVTDPATGAVALSVETLRAGLAANRFRQALAVSSTQELQRTYTEFYRKHFGKVSVAAPLRVKDDRERNEIMVFESYRLDDPWQVGERQSLIVPTAAEVADQLLLPQQRERAGPFVAAAARRVDYEARLSLPETWRPDATALDEEVRSPAFEWASRREQTDRQLVLGHRYAGVQMVLPAEDLDAHVSAVKRAEELSHQGFRVITAAHQRRSDRDERLRSIIKSARERAAGVDHAER